VRAQGGKKTRGVLSKKATTTSSSGGFSCRKNMFSRNITCTQNTSQWSKIVGGWGKETVRRRRPKKEPAQSKQTVSVAVQKTKKRGKGHVNHQKPDPIQVWGCRPVWPCTTTVAGTEGGKKKKTECKEVTNMAVYHITRPRGKRGKRIRCFKSTEKTANRDAKKWGVGGC